MTSGKDLGISPLLKKAQVAALRSQLHDLKAELREYESLRSGHHVIAALPPLEELPLVLIRARIASGITQQGLARKLGIHAQQVQRYEATDYRSASLERLEAVARALGLVRGEPIRTLRRPPGKVSRNRKAARKGTAAD